jgi:ubiquinone/menaquinone biosynthesis C-methylase UbiE
LSRVASGQCRRRSDVVQAIDRCGSAARLGYPSRTMADASAETVPPADLPEYDLAYRDVFWSTRGYEDLADRTAIRALLPREGGRLIEVGAGFGRLVDEYAGYRDVVLFDSSKALLDAGRERLGGDPRIQFVEGDAHRMPFDDASFDAIVCVRVAHHFPDAPRIVAELARILRPGGVLVLEFANKRHLKSVVKYALRRQDWSPFSPEPYEYRPLHFDHSPGEVKRLLRDAGFRIGPTRTASLFRVGALKRRVPARVLAGVERPLQAPLGVLALGPSVYLRARRVRTDATTEQGEPR